MKYFDARVDSHATLGDYLALRAKYRAYSWIEAAAYRGIADDIKFAHHHTIRELKSDFPLYLAAASFFQVEGLRWGRWNQIKENAYFSSTLYALFCLLEEKLKPQTSTDYYHIDRLVNAIAYQTSLLFIEQEVPVNNDTE
jgi:hypothetical protein